MDDKPGKSAFVTEQKYFEEIFRSVPKARMTSVDVTAYEELGRMYHMGIEYRSTLFALVRRINAGGLHTASADLMGDLMLVGIGKPDGGTRPIGVPSALRRLAGRVMIHQMCQPERQGLGRFFTTTTVPAEMLVAAGFSSDTPCNVPLQLGVGVHGGAEIAIGIVRTYLGLNPGHAIASDDKKNGFNSISRRAIFAGLRLWFPECIPAVRQWYARQARLFWRGEHGVEMAADEANRRFYSEEGCAQGDPLGPFLWAIGYHYTLLEVQAHHPTTQICAYLDDTYYLQEPSEALAAMHTGARLTARPDVCNVASNTGKQEIFSPRGADGVLDAMPATLRGSPHAPPNESKGYAGGLLECIKVLGAYVGDDEACSRQLVARVTAHMADLPRVAELQDTPHCRTSLQVQLCMNRFCANTRLVYFLRTMPPSVTRDAARLHDALVARLFHSIVGTAAATADESEAAEEQARLPVKMGGLGLTSMLKIRGAAWAGGWALTWRPIQQLVCSYRAGNPEPRRPFLAVDIATADLPFAGFKELQSTYAGLLATHARVATQWATYDKAIHDFTPDGAAHYRFHPRGLCEAADLLPLERFGAESPLIAQMQRRLSSIIHHEGWRVHWNMLAGRAGPREAVRFVAASQPYAGAFLNAIPMAGGYRMPTWAMRLQVQRRLGLPITIGCDGSRRSKHGKLFDVYGDVAQNDGLAGHAHRHTEVLKALVKVCRGVWGTRVEAEPQDYTSYSTHRPDFVAYLQARNGSSLVADVKVGDPIGSNATACARRGIYVGLGNIEPHFNKQVHGLTERGDASLSEDFDPGTGRGYVAACDGDYAQTKKLGHDVRALVFESLGGFGREVERLLKRLADDVSNKLSAQQYDEATWSTRSWLAFQSQRLSVALHMALAWEIGQEYGLGVCCSSDPREMDDAGAVA